MRASSKHFGSLLLAALGGLGIAAWLNALGVFDAPDRLAIDAWMRSQDVPPSAEVALGVLSEEDASALEEKGHSARDRGVHAEVVDLLIRSGARAVGFDLLFDQPGEPPAGDAEFEDELGANSNVVLAFVGQIHGDRGLQSIPLDLLQRHSVPAASRTRFPQASTLLLPNPDFCHAAGALGFGTAPDPAPDGVVRPPTSCSSTRGDSYRPFRSPCSSLITPSRSMRSTYGRRAWYASRWRRAEWWQSPSTSAVVSGSTTPLRAPRFQPTTTVTSTQP